MQLLKCPACGATVLDQVTSRVVVCEYCGSQFILDEDEADAVLEANASDENEEYYNQWESMAEFAQAACSDFLDEHGDDRFSVTGKIYGGLGVDDDEEIFIIHDDTMFGSGKNGFAITENGLYCREMGEPAGIFLDWASFAQYDKPYVADCYVLVNDVRVCYYTNDNDFLPYLQGLYDQLQEAAQYLTDWDEGE